MGVVHDMKNTASNTLFNIYLLYPTDRDDEANFYRLLQNYTNIGTEIYAYLIDWEKMDYINDNIPFPKFRLYVPADHEVFINSAYKSGFLTKEQITSINCKIIEECNLLISFGSSIKMTGEGGCVIGGYTYSKELDYATQEKIPVYTMPDLSPHAIQALKLAIKLIIQAED